MGILISNIAAINQLYRMGLLRYMEGYEIKIYTVDFALQDTSLVEKFLFNKVKKIHKIDVLEMQGNELSVAFNIKSNQNHQISIETACSIFQCMKFGLKLFSNDERAIAAAKNLGIGHKSVNSLLDMVIDESIGIAFDAKNEIIKILNETGI